MLRDLADREKTFHQGGGLSVLPPWPPKDSTEAAMFALFVAAFSALISALALILNSVTLAFTQRRERIRVKLNHRYRIDLRRDRYLFPSVVDHHSLKTGDRCRLLTIAYSGRHSLRLGKVYAEIDRASLVAIEPYTEDRELFDGQVRPVLVAEGMFSFKNLTGFVIETTSHGNRYIRANLWRHLELYVFFRWPGLYTLYNKHIKVTFEKDLEMRRVIERALDPKVKEHEERPHPPH